MSLLMRIEGMMAVRPSLRSQTTSLTPQLSMQAGGFITPGEHSPESIRQLDPPITPLLVGHTGYSMVTPSTADYAGQTVGGCGVLSGAMQNLSAFASNIAATMTGRSV